MKKRLQPLPPAALYVRMSSDRQDVDLDMARANTDISLIEPLVESQVQRRAS